MGDRSDLIDALVARVSLPVPPVLRRRGTCRWPAARRGTAARYFERDRVGTVLTTSTALPSSRCNCHGTSIRQRNMNSRSLIAPYMRHSTPEDAAGWLSSCRWGDRLKDEQNVPGNWYVLHRHFSRRNEPTRASVQGRICTEFARSFSVANGYP